MELRFFDWEVRTGIGKVVTDNVLTRNYLQIGTVGYHAMQQRGDVGLCFSERAGRD